MNCLSFEIVRQLLEEGRPECAMTTHGNVLVDQPCGAFG